MEYLLVVFRRPSRSRTASGVVVVPHQVFQQIQLTWNLVSAGVGVGFPVGTEGLL